MPIEPMGSAEFWSYVGGVDMVESYDSLDAIIAASDLIVVADVTGFREGRKIKFPDSGETMYMAEVRARVTETLRGQLQAPPGSPETLVVETSYGFSPDPATVATLEASTPVGDTVVLFLVNKTADAKRHEAPPGAPYLGADYLYLLLKGDQAAMRNERGTARIGPEDAPVSWVEALDGKPFDDAVREIKDAIASS